MLGDEELGQACFDPLIQRYKEEQTLGNDLTILFNQLTRGQQALFVFQTHYVHASESLTEFYWWSAYFLATGMRWTGLKSSLGYFGEDELLDILESTEKVLVETGHPRSLEQFDLSRDHLHQHPKLLASIEVLEERYQEVVPGVRKRIAAYIRSHPEEFIQLEEDTLTI
ncbi:hypothetical protein EJP77_07605 [Paenibacillus zeisoli]|uniref:DUF4375 domain-containing protein n=1 Tax=Paenibacillus zeisoli TaxID=2496267 RepID=A0A3S1DZ39_9BACL|nr:hypothetical protein [Paenibacillus zeisoli]RUT33504.1 hypothetical protein EJP77_07605 [Paenibacillus zeisoli]